jgi:hypothetical protein
MACAEARALGPDMDTDNSQLPVAAVPAEKAPKTDLSVPTPAAPDTRPLYERIGNAAWDVTRAYGDEDLGAPERAVYVLQRLLPPSVRVYALDYGMAVCFLDVALRRRPRTRSDSFRVHTLVVGRRLRRGGAHPEGTATVLKDRRTGAPDSAADVHRGPAHGRSRLRGLLGRRSVRPTIRLVVPRVRGRPQWQDCSASRTSATRRCNREKENSR